MATSKEVDMIRSHFGKRVAVIILIVFSSIITGAAYPLHAQETPGAIEKTGQASVQSGGGSILPIVLIGVGVLAVAAVLIFVVFKTSYDITGSWVFVFTGPATYTYQATFTGTKDSGTYLFPATPMISGTYTVSDKAVTMAVTADTAIVFTGSFTSKDAMSGNWTQDAFHYTWTATRGTLTTSPRQAPAISGSLVGK
jgi:hypothetical protein